MSKNYQKLIKAALHILLDCYEGSYTQREVVTMLKQTDLELGFSALNKLKKNIEAGDKLGSRRAKRYAIPLEEVVYKVLGKEYNVEKDLFLVTENTDWQSTNLLSEEARGTAPSDQNAIAANKVFHSEGRWSPSDKSRFFSTAKKEVIEFGVKLENFVSYFYKYGDDAYKKHIIDLLKKGVNFKCFMLEPDSNTARLYFGDRAKANKEEEEALNKMPEIKQKLIEVAKDLNALGHEGSFEVYTYKNIPHNHFLSIDFDTANAKMLIAHYIYGVSRSKSPLLVFSKKEHPELYRLYATSLKALLKQAKKVFPLDK